VSLPSSPTTHTITHTDALIDEKGERRRRRSGKEFKTRLWLTICLVGFYYDYLLSFLFSSLALPKGLWCR
jgi:hypothetical protein